MPTNPFASAPDLQPRSICAPADAGEFVLIDDVPIFDAHTGDDGTEYDEHLLAQIAENNNRRIRDTGDYVPLIVGHTPEDPESERSPPMVGMAGPFHVGRFGAEKPRPCIFAKFWVWKDKLQEFRANPRRSVELWPEENPEERYFDPIALLGAQTPRRDLGLVYCRSGRRPRYRYEMAAAAPSGTNTFLPGAGMSGDDDEPELQLDDFMQRFAKRFADEFAGLEDDRAAERIGGLDDKARAIVDRYFASHCDDGALRERYSRLSSGPSAPSAAPPPAPPPARPTTHTNRQTAEQYRREAIEWRDRCLKSRAATTRIERKTYQLQQETAALKRSVRFHDRLNDAAALAMWGVPLDSDAQLDLVSDHDSLSDKDWQELLMQMKRDHKINPLQHMVDAAQSRQAGKTDDRAQVERTQLSKKASDIAYRYQRDPRKAHIKFRHVLRHLIANNGKLDERTIDGD